MAKVPLYKVKVLDWRDPNLLQDNASGHKFLINGDYGTGTDWTIIVKDKYGKVVVSRAVKSHKLALEECQAIYKSIILDELFDKVN